ncbi:MAG: response regulator [Acetobacteraceae bacterium]|nr:response regulator [Acetobacteraceae bacterium]
MNAQFPLPGHSAGARGYIALPSDALVVHIIDDDEAVRRSLALLLNSFGLAAETYDSAESLLAQLDSLAAGCLVVDVRMPGMDGLELQLALQERGCNYPVLVVTGHGDVGLAVKAMKAGALDFIEKPYSDAELLASVRSALARVADTRHSGMVVEAARARIAVLTPRERDVLMRLVEGRPNKVIAHELGISPRTVEIHRANMMEKLACRSLAEAVRLAIAAEFHQA